MSSITPILANNNVVEITTTLPTTFKQMFVAIPIKSSPGCDMSTKSYSTATFKMQFLNVKNNLVDSSPANAYYIAIGK